MNAAGRTATQELNSCCPTPILRQGALFIKNDGESGVTYGGNKVRKLSPVFDHLKARGYHKVLTVGAAGSHHVLASGLFAPASGLSCAAILVQQPHTEHAANMLRLMTIQQGLELHPCRSVLDVSSVLRRERGEGVAWMGPGAIGALAASGYRTAFQEWLAQREALGLGSRFEHHVVAAGSGGTAAGLLAGLIEHQVSGRVVAVAVNQNPFLRSVVAVQAWAIRRRLGRFLPVHFGSTLVVDRSAVGRGYGYPSEATNAAILRAEEVGLHLEHTYTAKAHAVAERLARQFPSDVVVFWQTLSQRPLPHLGDAPPLEALAPALRRLLQPI